MIVSGVASAVDRPAVRTATRTRGAALASREECLRGSRLDMEASFREERMAVGVARDCAGAHVQRPCTRRAGSINPDAGERLSEAKNNPISSIDFDRASV